MKKVKGFSDVIKVTNQLALRQPKERGREFQVP
jgi:hypothetical protein